MKNSKTFTWELSTTTEIEQKDPYLVPNQLPNQLIGDKEEPFPQLKTKDNVDHAGLSPPLVPWKEPMPSEPEPSPNSLNNPWLTVITMTVDAMED